MALPRKKRRRARRKKGAGAPPSRPEGSRVEVEGRELAVLVFPMSTPAFPPTLSAAEREVALAVVEGRSNAEIAATRRTSVRTVANQIVATYRKLGVRSRAELIVSLVGTTAQRRRGSS
jgi:DNA-binding NarL/FixJ family response regulator